MKIKVTNKETKEEQFFNRVIEIVCGVIYGGRLSDSYPYFELRLPTKEIRSERKVFNSEIYTFELIEHTM